MPPRSLRRIRPSAGASWARADGATAAVAVAAAVVLMKARRFISFGAVMTLLLELDESRPVAAAHHASWTGASRQPSPPCGRALVIRASVRGINPPRPGPRRTRPRARVPGSPWVLTRQPTRLLVRL